MTTPRTEPRARPVRKPTHGTAPTAGPDLELATLAKAVGHPARIAILRILQSGECVCGAIVDRLPLAQATVSQHLKVLKDAGLIRGEIDPPRVCYCIDSATVRRLKQLIAAL